MNNKPDITLKILTRKDLVQVAHVHSSAFRDSALTKLGKEPIRRYYEWQLTGPHECHALGAFDQQGLLVGFCFAGVFHGSLSGFLTRNKKFLTCWVLSHPWKITNPLVVDRLKQAILILKRKSTTTNHPSTQPKMSYGILSIAVDPEKQGMGIGRIIMQDVEQDALQKGFAELNLTVHPTNTKAVTFYEGCGWQRVIKDSAEWSGSMVKPLAK